MANVDTALEHVPIDGGGTMVWTSNWVPYIWSIRDLCGVEVAHTALANWQAGRTEAAYDLWRGALADSMFGGRAPGGCLGTSDLHGRMAGLCTDFADTVGMYGRALVEGLFGIVPDALAGELVIRPGLPRDWPEASLDTPDVGYSYKRQGDTETFAVRAKFRRPMRLRLRVVARRVELAEATINGQPVSWQSVRSVGGPMVELLAPQADGAQIVLRWSGPEPARADVPAMIGQGEPFTVSVGHARLAEVHDPQGVLREVTLQPDGLRATATGTFGHRTAFARVEQGRLSWWEPLCFELRPPLEIAGAHVDKDAGVVQFSVRNNTGRAVAGEAQVECGTGVAKVSLDIPAHAESSAVRGETQGRVSRNRPGLESQATTSPPLRVAAEGLVPGTNPLTVTLAADRVVAGAVVDWRLGNDTITRACECLDLSGVFNDRVTEIFRHEYRTPRSPYCSLQIPLTGHGDWCYGGKVPPPIDDAALRTAAGPAGRFVSPQGLPFATPGPGQQPNVVFTSRWDNFPAEVTVALAGRARHAWFLVAGSTHPMHAQLDNGEMIVAYADGAPARLPLHNPTTWWPIEADYQVAVDGFCIPGPHPPRIDLGAGRATVVDLPLDPGRDLRALTLRCLANEVVVGLLSATILRPR